MPIVAQSVTDVGDCAPVPTVTATEKGDDAQLGGGSVMRECLRVEDIEAASDGTVELGRWITRVTSKLGSLIDCTDYLLIVGLPLGGWHVGAVGREHYQLIKLAADSVAPVTDSVQIGVDGRAS